jgi:hypothetical protein
MTNHEEEKKQLNRNFKLLVDKYILMSNKRIKTGKNYK